MSLTVAIVVLVAAAIAIGFIGTRLAVAADRLADQTGLGEALVGAVLLGGSTSLSGVVTSVTAAADGRAELAVSNAIGGIAAQTVFLALGDLAWRKVNLEHAAASVPNMAQGTLLIALLALVLLAGETPDVTIWRVHPVTLLLFATYLYGLNHVRAMQARPMWSPAMTVETRIDEPDEAELHGRPLTKVALRFAVLGASIGLLGWVVAKSGEAIVAASPLDDTIVGALLTAVATSTPELITTVAAVRRGALTLAVGGIIGGNTFDVLFVAFADIGYREGSIYHAVTGRQDYLIGLSILLTTVLVLGLLRREKHGPAGIGFESLGLLLIYGLGIGLLFVT